MSSLSSLVIICPLLLLNSVGELSHMEEPIITIKNGWREHPRGASSVWVIVPKFCPFLSILDCQFASFFFSFSENSFHLLTPFWLRQYLLQRAIVKKVVNDKMTSDGSSACTVNLFKLSKTINPTYIICKVSNKWTSSNLRILMYLVAHSQLPQSI